MVKIVNPLGDVKIGRQDAVVYQRKYGEQIRRLVKPKGGVVSQAQIDHRNFYRAALDWRKSLSLANRRYLDGYCIANWVVDDHHIPLPWSKFALKIYLQRAHFVIVTQPEAQEAGPPVLQEHFDQGATIQQFMYGNRWLTMTFTPQEAHHIAKVTLQLYRSGTPGTLTISIKETDAQGKPTGADLCLGTTDANTLPTGSPYEWRDILFAITSALDDLTKYAIVARALDGSTGNRVYWRDNYKTPTYEGGSIGISTDGGLTWTMYDTHDFMFKEWGQAPPTYKEGLLHVKHPALLTVVQKRQGATIKEYDSLSSLDEEYLTKQVGLDVLSGDIIEATTLPGIFYRYEVG